MASSVYEDDGKGKANFYKHQHAPIARHDFAGPLYNTHYPIEVVPTNFIGRHMLRPPPDESMAYAHKPPPPPTPRMAPFVVRPMFQ